MKNVGLVLAGGGLKGSYQVGVWQALMEMDIDVSVIVGTSIGAVNGALFTQGDVEKAYQLWTSLSLEQVVDCSDIKSDNIFEWKNISYIISELYNKDGLDTTPFKNLLLDIIDEHKIRTSPIDYGLVTYSMTDRKSIELFKKDIPKGEIVDYILASTALPVFQKQSIENKTLIDGGINNNMPINMLMEKGIHNIITVDVGGFGMVKKVNTTGINVFSIKSSEKIIGTMNFHAENIKRNIKAGYCDCYKVFGRLMGDNYYFNSNDYCLSKMKYSSELLKGLEYAGDIFNIEKYAIYKISSFIHGVMASYKQAQERYKEQLEKLHEKNFFATISKGEIQLENAMIVIGLVDIILKGEQSFLNNLFLMKLLGNNFYAANTISYLISNGYEIQ